MSQHTDKPMVFTYLRWSSGIQALGDSERRQMQSANYWLEKNGYEIDHDNILRDDGLSGFTGENLSSRGELGKFIDRVKNKEYEIGTVLIIEDFSRFSRSTIGQAQMRFLELIENGIRVYVTKDDKEYNKENNTLTDAFTALSKMDSAREESHRKSEYLKSFWIERRRLAEANKSSNNYPTLLPATAPDWIRKVKGNGKEEILLDAIEAINEKKPLKFYEPIPERVEVIKRIFELADIGAGDGLGLGSTIIVRVLEKEGVKPFKGERGNTARTFNDSYVLRLIKDQRLLGFLQPHVNPVSPKTGKRVREPIGDPIPNYFPPVIDKELFDRVNFKLQKRKIYQSGKISKKFSNLFTKLVKCSFCGHSMTLFSKRGSKAEGGVCVYLQCSEGTKLKKCGNRAVRYFDTFEKTIIKTLLELDLASLFRLDNSQDVKAQDNIRHKISKKQDKLRSINKKMQNALELLLEDPSDIDIKFARDKLKDERVFINNDIDDLNDELMSLNRKVNHLDFKDNLELVLNSMKEDDDLATYNIRRSINTYLIDVIQYISINGQDKSCWVVFDLRFFTKKIEESISLGNQYLNNLMEGKIQEEQDYIPSEKEIRSFGTSPLDAHLKIKLNRFIKTVPSKNDILSLRESFEIAPPDLVKINEIVNSAINRNFKSLKRKEYKVLDGKLHDEILDKVYVSPVGYSEQNEEADLKEFEIFQKKNNK